MGSSGTNTTTSTTTPPPEVMAAYQNLIARAQGVADTPYTPYGGQLVAGLTPGQTAGINQVSGAAGVADPYYDTARGMFGAGADTIQRGLDLTGTAGNYFGDAAGMVRDSVNGFDPARYMSPYTQNVIDTTMANINKSNAIQQNDLQGAAIRTGNAFGGDRMGVAQAELARNQDLASGQIIAGLQNQNYAQALGESNVQQQLGLSGAGLLGNLGQSFGGLGSAVAGMGGMQANLGAGYAGLGAQQQAGQIGAGMAGIQAGGVGQQNQQAALDAAYQQFLTQQGYPFATTNFLGNQVLGVGSASGGTSTTTGPRPAMSFLKDGGRVSYVGGGGIDVPYGGVPWIKVNGQSLPIGKGPPGAPSLPQSKPIGVGEMIAAARGGNDLYKWAKGGLSDMFSGVPSPKGEGFAPIQDIANPGYAIGPEVPGFYTAAGEGLAGAGAAGIGAEAATGIGIGAAEAGLGATGLAAGLGTELAAAFPAIAAMFMARGGQVSPPPRRFAHGGLALGYARPRFADGGLALPQMMNEAPPIQYAPPPPPAPADPGMASLMGQVETATQAFRQMRHRAQGGLVMPSNMPLGFARGGLSMGIPRYAKGGLTFDDRFGAAFEPSNVDFVSPGDFNRLDAAADYVPLPQPRPAGLGVPDVSDDSSPNWAVARGFQDFRAGDGPTFAPLSASNPPPVTAGLNIPMPPPRPNNIGDGSMPQLFSSMGQDQPRLAALPYDGSPAPTRGLSVPPPARTLDDTAVANSAGSGLGGVGPTSLAPDQSGSVGGHKRNGLDDFMDSPWLALAAGVLGAMASPSPFRSVAIGEGALSGLSTYAAARKMSMEAERVREQLRRQDAQQMETVRSNKAREGESTRYHDILEKRYDADRDARNYRAELSAETRAEMAKLSAETRREIETMKDTGRTGRAELSAQARREIAGMSADSRREIEGIRSEDRRYGIETRADTADKQDVTRKEIAGMPSRTKRTMTPLEIDREARMRAEKEIGKPDDLRWLGKDKAYEKALQERRSLYENELRQRYGIQATGSEAPAAQLGDAPAAPAASSAPPKISTKAEYDKLPSKSPYTAPDGSVRMKP